MNFIFGYGSLICSDSRSRTGVSGPAHPIEVQGIARKWSVHVPDYAATAVGAHSDAQGHCNGVFFAVDEDNLSRFDGREKGYRRIQVPWAAVQSTSTAELPALGTLWAYVGTSQAAPHAQRPIMQSYLDVILNGCLNYGPDFARRFTELTGQWQYLVNDRAQPTYPRPLKSHGRLPEIDQVMLDHLPDLWAEKQEFAEKP
ncbi:gamma-glutamylcyclotransferase family protein [Reinekea sp.]|jgi:cation transport regulator ChaC|uniref:gamma-glutamylcyclotransferase family protein n=1 Tax=Reinekea sp. TaxID=1970455 RepID=UPI002A7FEFA8|nr:gamma-glutamylcyclotransferase family protein [Reinekea sp.]